MRGHRRCGLVVGVLCGLLWAGAARAEVKIGYVNSEKILEQSKEAKAALDGFSRDVDGWNQEAQQRRKDLDDLTRELGQQTPMLSDDKRREKEQDLQRKLTEYDQFVQSIWGPNGLVIRRNEEVLRPVVAKIQTILEKIGGEEGFDLILDAADGNVLYADRELDLTQLVIDQLNAEQP
jgi:outer membrane protein